MVVGSSLELHSTWGQGASFSRARQPQPLRVSGEPLPHLLPQVLSLSSEALLVRHESRGQTQARTEALAKIVPAPASF